MKLSYQSSCHSYLIVSFTIRPKIAKNFLTRISIQFLMTTYLPIFIIISSFSLLGLYLSTQWVIHFIFLHSILVSLLTFFPLDFLLSRNVMLLFMLSKTCFHLITWCLRSSQSNPFSNLILPLVLIIKSIIFQLSVSLKTIKFLCVSSHVGILGNVTADILATSTKLFYKIPATDLLHFTVPLWKVPGCPYSTTFLRGTKPLLRKCLLTLGLKDYTLNNFTRLRLGQFPLHPSDLIPVINFI